MQSRVKETVSYTWTIENYASQNSLIESPTFSSTDESKTFSFGLYSNVEPATKHIFLKFWYDYDPNVESYFKYRASIVGKNDEKLYSREYHWRYDSMCCYNIVNFIFKSKISKFLLNGHLTLLLEVDILDGSDEDESIDHNMISQDLSADYQTLFESGKLADFTVAIVGGDGHEKQFRVHKTVLAARSAVFGVMFEHPETKEMQESRMELDDISVETCEELLRFIYTGKVLNMSEHASELLAAADKYQLEQLKRACERSLSASLSVEAAASALLLADLHSAAQFKSSCIDLITNNSVAVMATEGWKVLAKSRPDFVVELFQVLAQKANPFIEMKQAN